MDKPAILIVEDDRSIRNMIAVTLEAEGYTFYTAENGREALLASTSRQPDIVLLDLGLPDLDGVDVIQKIRSWSEMPIIIISARSDDKDKVEALDAGADDYITKPFSVEELLARVGGEEVHLTNMEYKLLAENAGKVLTYKYLLRQVWAVPWKAIWHH